MNCQNNIAIEQTTDVCNGKTIKTSCVINPPAITLLELEPNSTQEEVNNALVLAITSLISRVELLESLIP